MTEMRWHKHILHSKQSRPFNLLFAGTYLLSLLSVLVRMEKKNRDILVGLFGLVRFKYFFVLFVCLFMQYQLFNALSGPGLMAQQLLIKR